MIIYINNEFNLNKKYLNIIYIKIIRHISLVLYNCSINNKIAKFIKYTIFERIRLVLNILKLSLRFQQQPTNYILKIKILLLDGVKKSSNKVQNNRLTYLVYIQLFRYYYFQYNKDLKLERFKDKLTKYFYLRDSYKCIYQI